MKRHTFWLKATIVLMLLTTVLHGMSLFIKPEPANETEKQLLDLMTTYKQDAGAGFTPTFSDLFNALSSCFSLINLLGGLTLTFLLQKKAEFKILKGIAGIFVLVFGTCFFVMLFLTFLPPIILTGLIFLCITVSYFSIPKAIESE